MNNKIKRTYAMIDYIDGINDQLKGLRKSITSLIKANLDGDQKKVAVRVAKFRDEMNKLVAERNNVESQLDVRFKIFLNTAATAEEGIGTYELWLEDFEAWLETQEDWVQELSEEAAPRGE